MWHKLKDQKSFCAFCWPANMSQSWRQCQTGPGIMTGSSSEAFAEVAEGGNSLRPCWLYGRTCSYFFLAPAGARVGPACTWMPGKQNLGGYRAAVSLSDRRGAGPSSPYRQKPGEACSVVLKHLWRGMPSRAARSVSRQSWTSTVKLLQICLQFCVSRESRPTMVYCVDESTAGFKFPGRSWALSTRWKLAMAEHIMHTSLGELKRKCVPSAGTH